MTYRRGRRNVHSALTRTLIVSIIYGLLELGIRLAFSNVRVMFANLNAEEVYRRLGRLLETVPEFGGTAALSSEQMTWLGRAQALVDAVGDLTAQTKFGAALNSLPYPNQRYAGFQTLLLVLYGILAKAELAAPPSAQGTFIPVGNSFDAYAAVAKVFGTATADILIIDPYMDDSTLLDFAGAVPDSVALRLLSDTSSAKPSLGPAATKWKAQYPQGRLEVRLATARALHDRAILVDGKDAWTVTQSLKDLAKRSPAEIVRAADIAALKIAAYDQIWMTAKVLV